MKIRGFGFVVGLVVLLTACDKPQFSQLPASQTGITFANRITETDSINILDYEYVYNGGGVGVADFNNDGLQDVYFTGNQVSNRLFLNRSSPGQGDFKFEDISDKAHVSGEARWCSGVALVDINADGWMDIYVGATTYKDSTRRGNLLYINQGLGQEGIPTFREMAKPYGIADNGYTTNAAFFDHDNDGDLDLYVLTDAITGYPGGYREKIRDGSSISTGRLYRNEGNGAAGHPVFTNVTRQAGLTIEGYGLGVNICDINRDGWKDIYVTNDFISNDLLWINNGGNQGKSDGPTFTDQAGRYFKHLSNSAMGNDVTDINNDGLADIVVLDMLPANNQRKKQLMGPNNYQSYMNSAQYGYSFEYARNTLQINQGAIIDADTASGQEFQRPVFSEISMLAGVAQTDWSWSPLVADFDHDGYRDLIVTNGFPKDVTDRDFVMFRAQSSSVASKQMLLEQIPAVKIHNYAFRNRGAEAWTKTPQDGHQGIFEDVSKAWGITEPSFSNGAAYADFDNDGDLDYVINNINDSAFVYRNNQMEKGAKNQHFLRINFRGEGQNRQGLGAIVELRYGQQQQLYEHSPYRGYLSTQEATAHFGLGDVATIDEVKIIWPNGRSQRLRNVRADQVLTVDVKNAAVDQEKSLSPKPALFTNVTNSLGIDYVHDEPDFIDFNIQKLLPHKLSQYGPSIAVGDVDGNGLDDVFLGGARRKQGTWLIQEASGGFKKRPFTADPDGEAKQSEDAGALLFDADADGDLDLYVVSGSCEQPPQSASYQDRIYRNDGKGNFSRDSLALPAFLKSGSCVKATDFDRDGDLDLFIGGRVVPERYPEPASCFLLRNDSRKGTLKFVDVTPQLAPDLRRIGLVCDALWTDYDNDGWPDLLLSGEWMPLTFLKNEKGKFNRAANRSQFSILNSTGWWNSLVSGDFDNDGDMDYIAGNLGLNTINRASETKPVRVYAKDFDKNNSFDAIPTVYFPDEKGETHEYPFHGRDDLIKQMISMRGKFPLFKDFAKATVDNLLPPDDRKDALVLEATNLQSSYVENRGDGTFALHPLPLAAQVAPVFGMVTDDFDADGHLDVLLVGNDFGTEVSLGRYDALNGLLLRGDGRGGFVPMSLQQSGVYVPGDAKGLVKLSGPGGKYLLAASQNQGSLQVFQQTRPARLVRLQPTDAVAELTYKNGQKRREEVPYGSSFYSQSARVLAIAPTVQSVEITDFRGRKRKLF
ncbi:MAG: VCBS repeat-containing protein [Cytophagaceae bacterium]|nr:VCBS repeat-containing protein [Cytophagaceae bacterium]